MKKAMLQPLKVYYNTEQNLLGSSHDLVPKKQ